MAIRVPSRAANLASKYDCSIPYAFRRDTAFFVIFHFFFSKKLDKKLTEFEFLNPIVRCFWDTRKSCKSSVQVGLLKSSWFSRWYGVFYEFFTFFSKNLDKKLTELEFLNLVVGCYQVTLKGCRSSVQVWLLKSLCFSSRFVVFVIFHFFSKRLRYKKTNRTWFSEPHSGWLSGYP